MGHHVIKCITTLFLFQLIALSLTAQGGGIFYQLTSSNGLSSNRTQAVIRDREGFYWIATQDGLNRFEGSSCKVYRNNRNDTNSLSHNNCIFLLEDNNGDIWIGTQMGLNRYKKSKDKFERFYFSNPVFPFQEVNSIRGLTQDHLGNIWVASGGLWQFNINSGKWNKFLNDPNDPLSIPYGIVYLLRFDPVHKGLWMSGRTGLIFFDVEKNTFYSAEHNPKKFLILNASIAGGLFAVDENGRVWFPDAVTGKLCNYDLGTNKIEITRTRTPFSIAGFSMVAKKLWIARWSRGPLIYDPATNTIDSVFLNYYHPQSPSSFRVASVYVDSTGIYWVSTDKGVNIYDPKAQHVKYYLVDPGSPTVLNLITCIAEESENILWVGTTRGLFEYNIAENRYEHAEEIHVNDDFVRCLYMQEDSVLWIGGHHELIRFDVKRKRVLNTMLSVTGAQSIVADKKNNIWVATWESGLFKFSKDGRQLMHYRNDLQIEKTPASNKLICVSFVPTKSYLWMGYNGGNGFSVLEIENEKFRHFKVAERSPDYLGCNTVNCITTDDRGNLWIGTHGGGLVCFDEQKNKFTIYKQSDGLKGDFVHAILRDDSSRIWTTTSNGLCILDPGTGSILNPGIDLSLTNNDFIPNGTRRKNGNFLFFAGNKIVEINPALFQNSSYPSRILLNGFKVFDKEVPIGSVNVSAQTIRLTYRQNFFSIQYSLVKPDPNSPVQYAYKLEGFDKDWNYSKERRVAYYTDVPSGAYTFEIKATDGNGRWAYFSKSLSILIVPPFWQQWWFIGATSVGIIALVYSLYRYRLNQVKKMLRLRNKISQDLHDQVASTLSGIKLYSELAKEQLQQNKSSNVQHSLEVISSNAAEMKADMSDIVWAINPQNDSLGSLLRKLKAYANELAEAATVNLVMKVHENLPEEKLTMNQRRNIFLICKEAVNNAIKYSKCNELRMEVSREDHTMLILIKDNGLGFDADLSNSGNGLINMRTRAKEIGAQLVINSGRGKGTTVGLRMKL